MTGTIQSIDPRGFGFVNGDDGARYFFHCKALPEGLFDQLRIGHAVRFEPTKHPFKGPRAAGLRLRDEPVAA